MNKLLEDFIRNDKVILFVDDILVATDTVEEHFEVLKQLLKRLSQNSVKLQLQKCKFLMTTIEFLGYEITFNSIAPSSKHVQSITNYPAPTDQKSLQRFIGFISYFRKFIPSYNKISFCLYDLLKKISDFVFGKEHLEAFETLKFVGGILFQKQNDNKFHPVMYYSRKSTEAESKLHSFELETLAVVYCLQRYRILISNVR
jgi:hypothetical protein